MRASCGAKMLTHQGGVQNTPGGGIFDYKVQNARRRGGVPTRGVYAPRGIRGRPTHDRVRRCTRVVAAADGGGGGGGGGLGGFFSKLMKVGVRGIRENVLITFVPAVPVALDSSTNSFIPSPALIRG